MTKPRIWPRRTSLPKPQSAAARNGATTGNGPRVSVVIPAYKAMFLERAIDSVLTQTYRDFELIIVDDASPDNIAAVVARFDDPRLRSFRLAKNGRVARARNAGIAEARGEWVAFLDDDDEWLPGKLEQQMARVEGSAFSVVYCDYRMQLHPDAHERRVPRILLEGDVLDDLLGLGGVPPPSTFVIKRSALLELGGFDEAISGVDDLDLWRRLAYTAHPFAVVPEVLAIKHNEHLNRVSADPVATFRAGSQLSRRWGRIQRERLGAAYDQRGRDARRRKVARRHRMLVKVLVRKGGRGEAWQYVRGMAPALPRGASFTATAFVVVLFGRAPYRLRKTVKHFIRGKRKDRTSDDGVESSD